MGNLLQILNQFVMLFRKNVIEKSCINWRALPQVKIYTCISDTPCIYLLLQPSREHFHIFNFQRISIPFLLELFNSIFTFHSIFDFCKVIVKGIVF
jgi:hypothetical protein